MVKLRKRTFGHFWKRYLDKLTNCLAFIITLLIIIGMAAIYILAAFGWFLHWWVGVISIILAIILTPLIMMLLD